jgi:mannose-6-phosphate isomerase-like protein (cupin superfamily)
LPEDAREIRLNEHDNFFVKKEEWHQIINPYDSPCHIIEIQYGPKTEEDDIERLYYFDEKE